MFGSIVGTNIRIENKTRWNLMADARFDGRDLVVTISPENDRGAEIRKESVITQPSVEITKWLTKGI